MMKRYIMIWSLALVLASAVNGCNYNGPNVETISETGSGADVTDAADLTDSSQENTEAEAADPDEDGHTESLEEANLVEELNEFRQKELDYNQPVFDTEQKLYSLAELREMPDSVLAVFRNELYARHGRIFQSVAWKDFFELFSWYEELYSTEQFYEQELFTEIEKENLKYVLAVEAERKGSFIFTPDNYPRVDGSTATIPLSEQYAADAMGIPVEEAGLYVLHTKTHNAYVNLINGRADIIFVTAPSEEELQLAGEAGVELEIYPVVKEAFVFLVNEQNPVKGLTGQQILDIYSGKLTNWSEAGGENQEIRAYQRPVNSGSQSGMLSLVMKDTPLMDAPSHYRYGEMDGLVEAISSYDNAEYAIGYSYYYYVSSMYFRKGVRLLAIDGVVPETASIQDGSYPYTTAYYAVIKNSEPEGSSARMLLNWIERVGNQSAETAGYVPLQ